MRSFLTFFLSILVITGIIMVKMRGFACAYSDFYQKNKRGWYWYEQQAKPEEQAKLAGNKNKTQPSEVNQTAVEELNQFKEELEERQQ